MSNLSNNFVNDKEDGWIPINKTFAKIQYNGPTIVLATPCLITTRSAEGNIAI